MLRAARWWAPGVVLIGDAAHFFGPETGVGAGLGLGDAHALARAVAGEPGDPDAACALYETWRAPVIRPYEAADPAAGRMSVPNVDRPPEERWPPVSGTRRRGRPGGDPPPRSRRARTARTTVGASWRRISSAPSPSRTSRDMRPRDHHDVPRAGRRGQRARPRPGEAVDRGPLHPHQERARRTRGRAPGRAAPSQPAAIRRAARTAKSVSGWPCALHVLAREREDDAGGLGGAARHHERRDPATRQAGPRSRRRTAPTGRAPAPPTRPSRSYASLSTADRRTPPAAPTRSRARSSPSPRRAARRSPDPFQAPRAAACAAASPGSGTSATANTTPLSARATSPARVPRGSRSSSATGTRTVSPRRRRPRNAGAGTRLEKWPRAERGDDQRHQHHDERRVDQGLVEDPGLESHDDGGQGRGGLRDGEREHEARPRGATSARAGPRGSPRPACRPPPPPATPPPSCERLGLRELRRVDDHPGGDQEERDEQRRAEELEPVHQRAAVRDEPVDRRARRRRRRRCPRGRRGRRPPRRPVKAATTPTKRSARSRPAPEKNRRIRTGTRRNANATRITMPSISPPTISTGEPSPVVRADDDRQDEQRQRVRDHRPRDGDPHGRMPREPLVAHDRVGDQRVRRPQRAVQDRRAEGVVEAHGPDDPAEHQRDREGDQAEPHRLGAPPRELLQVQLEAGQEHQRQQAELADPLHDPLARDPVEHVRADHHPAEDDPDHARQTDPPGQEGAEQDHGGADEERPLCAHGREVQVHAEAPGRFRRSAYENPGRRCSATPRWHETVARFEPDEAAALDPAPPSPPP